jgi:hypothetical protein
VLSRSTRLLLALAGGTLLFFLALWGATGLVLRSTWLLEQVNAEPDSLFVTYTSPRPSFRPGRLKFATLTIRSRDANAEWEARLEDATVDVALVDLIRRRFHAPSVRAEALSFRLRERLTKAEATPARAARFPRIAGFSDPPLLEPAARPGPRGDPWRVVVDDLRIALVREVWIDSWRWVGEGRLAGGFYLRPGYEAEVFPSEFAAARGTLNWGDEVASRETAGSVHATLPRWDTQAYPGNEVWKIVSGAVSLGGSLDSLAFLAPDGAGPRLTGDGSVRIRIHLQDGKGRARLDAAAGRVAMRVGARTLRGSFRLEAFASRIDFPAGTVALDGTRVAIRDAAVDGASGPPWSASAGAWETRFVLADGALDAHLTARFSDGRPLVALVPSGPPRWFAGLLDLHDFEAHGRLRAAPGRLALSPAHAEAGTFSIDADWRNAGGRGWGAVLVRKGSLSLGIGLAAGGTSVHMSDASAWFDAEGRPGGLRTDQAREAGPARRMK